jgi:hypothetical protein
MARFQNISFTRTIAAGSYANFSVAAANSLNVVKIKIVPSIFSAPTTVFMYKNGTYADADLIYATKQYTGSLIDPCEENGVIITERSEGFLFPYEDLASAGKIYIRIENAHTASVTYTGTITYETVAAGGTTVALTYPEWLLQRAIARGSEIMSRVRSFKNTNGIFSAEFRAKFVSDGSALQAQYDLRTPAEGGTLVHDGTTAIVAVSLVADETGSQYVFTASSPGRWYYAWKLYNASGASLWTDGNTAPAHVTKFIDTTMQADDDKPDGWDVYVQDGPVVNTVLVSAKRPSSNSLVITDYIVQIKDAVGATWKTLLAGIDANHLKHDGRAISYNLGSDYKTLTDATNSGFGTAAAGDLVVLDVRGAGATWDEQYCQWALVRTVSASTLVCTGFFYPQLLTNLRLIIIKHPMSWQDGGYLGGESNHGWWPTRLEDQLMYWDDWSSSEFITTAFEVPAAITGTEARVWFENGYCRNDNDMTRSCGRRGFAASRLFNNFNDRRYWIPIYSSPETGSVVFNSANGSVRCGGLYVRTVTQPYGGGTNKTVTPGDFWGVKGRFEIYPDDQGYIELRGRWEDVQLDAWPFTSNSFSQDRSSLAIMGAEPSGGIWFPKGMVMWGNYGDDANIVFTTVDEDMYATEGTLYPFSSKYGTPPHANYITASRPAAGYNLEIKLKIANRAGVAYLVTEMAYSLDDGSTWIDNNTGLAYSLITIGDHMCGLRGLSPMFGIIRSRISNVTASPSSTGIFATLKEFEVIKGIVVEHRLVR